MARNHSLVFYKHKFKNLNITHSAALKRALGALPHSVPQFWGPAILGRRNFYVLRITETCKIWARAAAEQQ